MAIDYNIQNKLREQFNPEGSLLRRQQHRMLELLIAVDKVCRIYNIPYWLSSGTLIGAVRHKGFIPWDDDLDIEMMRSDYLRLLEVLPKELPSNFVLQTNETDSNYISVYAKVRDLNSLLEETNGYDLTWKYQGIYIDIFPIEKNPFFLAWIGGHCQGQIYNQINNKSLREDVIRKRSQRIFKFNKNFSFPILRSLAKLIPTNKLRHSFGTAFFKPRYKKDIFPLSEMEFEGKMFPVPHDSDSYLKRIYGDYMKLPDLKDIHPHYSKLEIYK